MDPTAEYLFEYLRDVIYNPSQAKLELNNLPESFRDLGEGLMFFARCIEELKEFSMALASGDLTMETPSRDNEFAAPLKTLQSTLRHLTWQTQQIANGDYKQRVDYLGEFADAFNMMIQQLDERRSLLMKEIEISKQKTLALKHSNDLFETITKENSQWLGVIERVSYKWLFINYPMERVLCTKGLLPKLHRWLIQMTSETPINSGMSRAELELSFGNFNQYFSVLRGAVIWHDQPSVVFMLTDISQNSKRLQELEFAANFDALTKLYNRNYGVNLLNIWISERKTFCLGFVDMDNLKYVNDVYGHLEGDRYILMVAKILNKFSPDVTVCRLGGDEFMLLQLGWTQEDSESQLESLREQLMDMRETENLPYFISLSYGVVEITEDNILTSSEILEIADSRMYSYKKTRKMERKDESIWQAPTVTT